MIRASQLTWLLVGVVGCAPTVRLDPASVTAVRGLDALDAGFEPAPDERKLWQAADDQIRELGENDLLLGDAALRAYLEGVAAGLLAQPLPDAAPPIRVRVARSAVRNATAYPNGVILVSLGLLCAMQNEAQLAALLGHELGHYLSRDRLRHQRYAESSGSTLARMEFSRRVEEHADAASLDLIRAAGYDPTQAISQLELLRHERPPTRPRFSALASHPDLEARIATVRARLAEDTRDAGVDAISDASDAPAGRVHKQAYESALVPHLLEGAELDLERGELDRARDIIDRYLRLRPDGGRGHYLRAEYLRRVDAAGDASPRVLAAYERAAALAPEDADVQRALGLFYRERGRAEDARRAFARYLELAPEAADRAIVESYLVDSGSGSSREPEPEE